jgi:hypothetical protein
VLLAVAFFCAGAARGQSLPASQPASAPADEPLAAVRQRLARVQPRERAPRDHALLAALDFALAVGRKDATQALRVVDAVGYQPLPLAGELPDPPERPLLLAALERQIGFLQPLEVGQLPSAVVAVRTPRELRAEFPGVATWMLPQDWAVVVSAGAGSAGAGLAEGGGVRGGAHARRAGDGAGGQSGAGAGGRGRGGSVARRGEVSAGRVALVARLC